MDTPSLFFSDIYIRKTNEFLKCGQFRIVGLTENHIKFNGIRSNDATWNLLIRENPAVGVLVHNTENHSILLVEQVRSATFYDLRSRSKNVDQRMNINTFEIVAGMIESNESGKDAAVRETMEEAGVRINRCRKWGQFYLSPGVSNEMVYLFYAPIESSQVVGPGGGVESENEDIRLHWVSIYTAMQMIEEGKIVDAKTIIAIQKLVMQEDLM